MNISPSFLYRSLDFFVSTLKHSISERLSLADQHKKIVLIATLAFACLGSLFAVIYFCCFNARRLTDVDDEIISPEQISYEMNNEHMHMLREIISLSTKGINRFGVYVTGNDLDFEQSIKELNSPCAENGIHIGCAGGHNFDIMAARKSKFGVIVDIGINNARFVELTQETISQASNRHDFVKRFVPKLKDSSIKIGEDILDRTVEKRMQDQLASANSWLGNDESFSYIQGLFKQKKVVALTMDMCDEAKFKQIERILKKYHLIADSVYLSNVRYFIDEARQQAFVDSITQLINDDTFVIHCPSILEDQFLDDEIGKVHFPIKEQKNSRRQSVVRGKDLKDNPLLYFVRRAKDKQDKNKVDLE